MPQIEVNKRLDGIRFMIGVEVGQGIAFVPAEDFPHCEPINELRALIANGQLRRLQRKWGRKEGDCHEIARALIADLFDCMHERPERPWYWMVGDCSRFGEHSWVESNGWAIDASHGQRHPITAMRVESYRRMMSARNVRSAIDDPPRKKRK